MMDKRKTGNNLQSPGKIVNAVLFGSWLAVLAATWSTVLAVDNQPAEKKVFSLGIGPQQATTELAKRWGPVTRYLSEKTGYDIQFHTTKDIPSYQKNMREGLYDLAYMNPYHYTLFRKAANYDAFAQEKDATLTGVLVVHKDSPYKSVKDLDGKTGAFPAPGVPTAVVLPFAHFKEMNVRVTPSYVVSHDSVYRAVAKGMYAVGGGEERTFNGMDPEVRDQLRVLWNTQALPPFLFAAHPRVPAVAVQRIREAMLKMDQDPVAKPLLKAINLKGISPAQDSDYDVVRRLNIQALAEEQRLAEEKKK